MADSISQRVNRRRESLRRAGLRPIQIWVPDTRSEDFVTEARRQSALLRDDAQEQDVLDWIDTIADDGDWH